MQTIYVYSKTRRYGFEIVLKRRYTGYLSEYGKYSFIQT